MHTVQLHPLSRKVIPELEIIKEQKKNAQRRWKVSVQGRDKIVRTF